MHIRKSCRGSGFTLLLACAGLLASDLAHAADLPLAEPVPVPAGQCRGVGFVNDPASAGELSVVVARHHAEAITVAYSEPQPALRITWANETKAWCGVAVGYFRRGVLDDPSVNRCLCFYEYMHRF